MFYTSLEYRVNNTVTLMKVFSDRQLDLSIDLQQFAKRLPAIKELFVKWKRRSYKKKWNIWTHSQQKFERNYLQLRKMNIHIRTVKLAFTTIQNCVPSSPLNHQQITLLVRRIPSQLQSISNLIPYSKSSRRCNIRDTHSNKYCIQECFQHFLF